MRKFPTALLAVAAASALALTGCGTTEAAEDASESPAPAGAGISIEDVRGEVIELDGPATTVVALEWNIAESLVSLGVMPSGVADVTNYASYVKTAPLDDTVTDVGGRGEPSIDAIAGLAPDLVIADNNMSDSAIAQIEEIAPVFVVRPADTADNIGQMELNLTNIAEMTGTEDEATTLLEDLDTRIADAAAELEAAGLAGESFALSDSYAYNGEITIRPYVAGSLLSDITEEIGLVNAWDVDGDADYGLGSVDVEALTALPDDVNYLTLGSDAGDIYTNELATNAIWTSLPFVVSGNVYPLESGIWTFGGPASMTTYIDAVVDALTA
jgi:ABC-type Fe3+-hydroxamate transport system substrate-binding protein